MKKEKIDYPEAKIVRGKGKCFNSEGEIVEVDKVTKTTYGIKQFWKIYLMDFLQVLGGIESRQLDVLIYILENVSSKTNLISQTYQEIQDGAGVSRDTVRRTMKILKEKGFIKKVKNGRYQISPEILMKGKERKKMILLEYGRCNTSKKKMEE